MITTETMNRLADVTLDHAVDSVRISGGVAALIGVWRDGACHVQVLPPPPRADEAGSAPVLKVMEAVVVGCEPDYITVLTDSYQAIQATKRDGTAWLPGQMQAAWENDTADKELVREAFTIFGCDATGSAGMVLVTYSRDADDAPVLSERKVVVEGEDGAGGGKLGGAIADMARRAFSQPTLSARMLREAANGIEVAKLQAWREEHPQEAMAHQIAAVTRGLLAPWGCSVVVATQDARIAAFYQEAFSTIPGARFSPGEQS